MFLDTNMVSWSSNKQYIVSRSSAGSECKAFALATSEMLSITYLLQGLKVSIHKFPTLYCDNKSVEALACNPKFYTRTNHIELDLHFICDHFAKHDLSIAHVSSSDQLVDILTKPLAYEQSAYLRYKFNVLPRP